jgi:hypothetical protein
MNRFSYLRVSKKWGRGQLGGHMRTPHVVRGDASRVQIWTVFVVTAGNLVILRRTSRQGFSWPRSFSDIGQPKFKCVGPLEMPLESYNYKQFDDYF